MSPSPSVVKTQNPFTGEVLKEYQLETFEEARDKIEASQLAFLKWKKVDVTERAGLLAEALQYFGDNREAIGKDISQQMGRPLQQACNEVNGLLERAEYLLGIAADALAPDQLEGKPMFDQAIIHEPLGKVLVISAWNYPLLITINGVMAALLAGNSVLLKHASATLSIGGHFARAFGSIAGHENLVTEVVLGHDTVGRIIEDGMVDHVIFTGSVPAGRKIYAHAAKALVGCNLELGGKDGAYVAADADVKQAAECLVDGAMYNSGQSCCGVERVYVHEDVYDEFLAECKQLIEQYVLGDPADPETNMGPLAQAESADFLQTQVDEAVAKGARVILGGQKQMIGKGVFYEPTLLVDVTHDMQVMQEENFGPIMPLMKVSDDDQAVNLVNDSQYGLTSAIFTGDKKKAERFMEQADTGTVFMNRCDYLDPALPWTGVKDSGLGSCLSKYGILGLTRNKAKHFKISS